MPIIAVLHLYGCFYIECLREWVVYLDKFSENVSLSIVLYETHFGQFGPYLLSIRKSGI